MTQARRGVRYSSGRRRMAADGGAGAAPDRGFPAPGDGLNWVGAGRTGKKGGPRR
jgi:hypothetical protein